MKKIVIFGGGTGLSQLLKGLKLFPVEITAVVSVADNGQSTGKLREEFDIPAVGDISKVLLAMADTDEDNTSLMNYRFKSSCSLDNHSVKNLVLTALLDMKGSLDKALPVFCKLFNIKGSCLPISEDSVNLVGLTTDGKEIVGEEQITKSKKQFVDFYYDKKININPKVLKAIDNANLIIISSGSLYTSILPHLIIPKIKKAIKNAKAKKIYVCNLVTQPGETDGFKVSDHLNILEKYIGKNTLDAVIVNNAKITDKLLKKYENDEGKLPVIYDAENVEKKKITVLADKTYVIENNTIRHDSLKTAYIIFSYLMDGK